MSTRATYSFELPFDAVVTMYIHHDGYPEGAAEYFKDAFNFKCEAPNASFADRFMRANCRAELTASHEIHADTEYRYHVDSAGILTATQRFGWDQPLEWGEFFVGPYLTFVSKWLKRRGA